MALCFPPQDQINQFRVSLTEGEAYLLRCLQDNLDDSFEVVNGAQKPPIHGCKSQLPSQKIIRI